MNAAKQPANQPKLEDLPLWREADALAEHMYSLLPQFPPEEEWNSKAKLRNLALDVAFWSSLALTDAGRTVQEADWGYFRKYANALKALYRFAGRRKFIELDPAIMVRLDKFCTDINVAFEQARKQSERRYEEEMARDLKPWRERYEIWKKLNGKES